MKHGVYSYEDDTFLIDRVAYFAKEGLERQETVIIVRGSRSVRKPSRPPPSYSLART
jgi:hypothetical protein